MKAISGFLAPTLLALVLMITVYPIRTWLERKGVPGVAVGAGHDPDGVR